MIALLSGACAHAPGGRTGATCDSFVEQDAATRRQLEALLTDAPGDQLVTEASRLNRERRACARQVLATLPLRREERGVEAMQRELEALVATYRRDDLDAMLAEALGDDAMPLRPYLAEARTKLERERRSGAAERRDASAAHRPGTDAAALAAFERHGAEANQEASSLLRAHEDAARSADRDAARSLGSLDEAQRRADRDAARSLDSLAEAQRRADRDAAGSLGSLDDAHRSADRDAARSLGSLDEAQRRSDRDAARSLGALEGAQRDASGWTSGNAATELPPLRPADEATAEALRAFEGSTGATGPCAASSACARLACDSLDERDADRLARRCLDDVSALPHDERARHVAAVLTRLRDFSPLPAATEALSTLETLRRQDWPGIEAMSQRGQRGLAAQRASPFLALDGARAEVQRLRDDAQAHHLRRARELASVRAAAWLHAKVAEQLGGPSAPPRPEKGRWGPPRWRCTAPAPEALPAVPPGVEAALHASCTEPRKDGDRAELRTFDLDLAGQRVEGFLVVACAEKSNSFSFRVEEPGVSGFPAEALEAELKRLLGAGRKWCREQHQLAALRECAELRSRSAPDVHRRFTLHALATGEWATCFREWLETTEGVTPPRLE